MSDIHGVSHLVVNEVTFRKGKENPGITAKFWRLENELCSELKRLVPTYSSPQKKKKKMEARTTQPWGGGREGGWGMEWGLEEGWFDF